MNRIQQLAKSVLEAAVGDDVELAKSIAREQVATDAELQQALIEYAIDVAVDAEWRARRQARRHEPESEFRMVFEPSFVAAAVAPSSPSATLTDGMRAVIADTKTRLMEWEMEPGKRLGDCTKPDLARAAARNNKQASTMRLDAAWYSAVAGMLPDNKAVVRAVLREADLTRLRRRVSSQCAA